MSEFNFVVLIKDKEIGDIAKYIKAENIEAYVFQANEDWNGVIQEEYEENRTLAEKMSRKFKAYVFDFVNSEDDGWVYTLFNKGKEMASLQIEYGETVSSFDGSVLLDSAKIPLLRDLAKNQAALGELERYLINKEQYTSRVFDGVEHFKTAFGFEQISWATYERFDQLPEDQKESLNAILVEKKQKKYNVKKTIIETVGEALNPRGYFNYKDDPLNSDVAFFKSVNGCLVGLQIFLTGFQIGFDLKSFTDSIDLYYLTGGPRGERGFSSESELKEILQDAIERFLTKGEELIQKEWFEPFNAEEIYKNTVDASLGRLGFKRAQTDNGLPLEGTVVYENNGSELVFDHSPYFVLVSCHFGLSRKNIAEWGPENSVRAFGFRNRSEYISILNNFVKFFEDWVLPNI